MKRSISDTKDEDALVTTSAAPTSPQAPVVSVASAASAAVQNALTSDPTLFDQLDQWQTFALKSIIEGKNVFITGPGGCGKTWLLRRVHRYMAGHKFKQGAITSMTGVTSLLVQGKTFASFFGFGVSEGDGEMMWEVVRKKSYLRKRFKSLSMLVIDEVSMLSSQMFEAASYVCQKFRANGAPFGGIQVILCGDFSQLPPVQGLYAFTSDLWKKDLDLVYCELFGNHRQSSDAAFHLLLNLVRIGDVNVFVRNLLKERVDAVLDLPLGVEAAELTSRRVDATKLNMERLEKLDASQEKVYHAIFTWRKRGELNQVAADTVEKGIRKNMVTPGELPLRIGAQVMLTYNMDVGAGLVNGSLGVVIGYKLAAGFATASPPIPAMDCPVVRFGTRAKTVEVVVQPHQWTQQDLVDKTVCVYEQIPLMLAWAYTVYKSQGTTLDWVKVKLDRGMFADGMAYVALSRAQRLEGLTLAAFQPDAIQTSKMVLDFYAEHQLAGVVKQKKG